MKIICENSDYKFIRRGRKNISIDIENKAELNNHEIQLKKLQLKFEDQYYYVLQFKSTSKKGRLIHMDCMDMGIARIRLFIETLEHINLPDIVIEEINSILLMKKLYLKI